MGALEAAWGAGSLPRVLGVLSHSLLREMNGGGGRQRTQLPYKCKVHFIAEIRRRMPPPLPHRSGGNGQYERWGQRRRGRHSTAPRDFCESPFVLRCHGYDANRPFFVYGAACRFSAWDNKSATAFFGSYFAPGYHLEASVAGSDSATVSTSSAGAGGCSDLLYAAVAAAREDDHPDGSLRPAGSRLAVLTFVDPPVQGRNSLAKAVSCSNGIRGSTSRNGISGTPSYVCSRRLGRYLRGVLLWSALRTASVVHVTVARITEFSLRSCAEVYLRCGGLRQLLRVLFRVPGGNFPPRLSEAVLGPKGWFGLFSGARTIFLLEISMGPNKGGQDPDFPEIPTGKLTVLGFISRALFVIWDMTTSCIFEALFLSFFGCCSGLLLPWVFLCIRVKSPRRTRKRCSRRGRRLLRSGAVLIGRSELVGRYVMLCRSGQLGSYVSLCGLRDVGCRVERVEHDFCRVHALLGPAVTLLRGLPVVVDLENEGGAAASAPDGPPEASVMEPAAPVESRGPGDDQAKGPPADDGSAEAGTVSLSSKALRDHQSQGHQPYVANCDACLCAKGRCPARRIKDPQKMSSAIGMDYLYFGKLRVLLMMHEMSRYTMAIPAQEDAKDDPHLVESVGNMIKEIGLQNRVITLRCDNENLLLAFGNHLASKSKQLGVERVIVDPVPGYRPQAKGGVERQVSVVKQAFWSNWLGMESEISRKGHEEEPLRLPLGGRLWSMCLLYVSRTINLFLCSPGDVATPIDLVHDEICGRPKTLPFGCLCACQVAGPRLSKKYRGRKLIRCIYLGPSRARGGGVLAITVGSSGPREVETFPACRGILENDRFVFLGDELNGIAGDDRSVLDVADPERPINFVPRERKRTRSEEIGAAEEEEEELIPVHPEGPRPGFNPELGYDPERGFQGTDSEYAPSEPGPAGEMDVDEDGDARMDDDELEGRLIDQLVHESLMGIYRGPDLGSGKSRSFEVPFCGSVIRCIVPDNAIDWRKAGPRAAIGCHEIGAARTRKL